MGFGSDVRVKILGDESSLKRAFESARRQAKETQRSFEETSKKSEGMFGASAGKVAGGVAIGAGAIVAGLADAGEAALQYEDKLKHLEVALKDAGTSYEANAKGIQAYINKNIDLGITENDTIDLLTKGVTATGDLKKAQELLTDAQNGAIQYGKPLSDVYLALIKGSEGQLRPLKQLGIDLPIAAGGALKTKQAYEGLVTAAKNLKDVQDGANDTTAKQTDKHNKDVLKAKEKLTDAEERYRTSKHHTVAQLEAIRHAQEDLARVESAGATSQVSGAKRIADAEAKVEAAKKKLVEAAGAGNTIIAAYNKKTAGAAIAQSQTIQGQIDKDKAKFAQFKRELGQRVISFVARDLIPGLEVLGEHLKAAGHNIENDLIDPLTRAWGEADHLFNSLTDALGLKSHAHDDSEDIYARNDKKMGWKPGTTKTMAGIDAQAPEHMAGKAPDHGKGSKEYADWKTAHGVALNPTDYGYNQKANDLAAGMAYAAAKSRPQPGDANFVGPLTPAEQHSTTIIHMHAQPTPAMVRAATDRHRKRNGRRVTQVGSDPGAATVRF